jgi:hypothetical protein
MEVIERQSSYTGGKKLAKIANIEEHNITRHFRAVIETMAHASQNSTQQQYCASDSMDVNAKSF